MSVVLRGTKLARVVLLYPENLGAVYHLNASVYLYLISQSRLRVVLFGEDIDEESGQERSRI